jgi:hypothetical protein
VLSISPPPPERLYRIDYKSAAKALQIYYKARHAHTECGVSFLPSKTSAVLVNEIPAPFGAPGNVRKYGKKFSRHIVSNWPGCKLIEKISSICAAPSALVSFGYT